MNTDTAPTLSTLLSTKGLNHHFCSFLPQKDLVNLLRSSKEVKDALSIEAKVRQLFYKSYILHRLHPIKKLNEFLITIEPSNNLKTLGKITLYPILKLLNIENPSQLYNTLPFFRIIDFSQPETYLNALSKNHSGLLRTINTTNPNNTLNIPLELNSPIPLAQQISNLVKDYHLFTQKEFFINILITITSITTSLLVLALRKFLAPNTTTGILGAIITCILAIAPMIVIHTYLHRFTAINQKNLDLQTRRDQILTQNNSLDPQTLNNLTTNLTFHITELDIKLYKSILILIALAYTYIF